MNSKSGKEGIAKIKGKKITAKDGKEGIGKERKRHHERITDKQ